MLVTEIVYVQCYYILKTVYNPFISHIKIQKSHIPLYLLHVVKTYEESSYIYTPMTQVFATELVYTIRLCYHAMCDNTSKHYYM